MLRLPNTLIVIRTQLALFVCRLHDRSNSGSVDMQDFRALHKFLEEMNQSFQMHDQDRSGSLNSNETHSALTSAGICKCHAQQGTRISQRCLPMVVADHLQSLEGHPGNVNNAIHYPQAFSCCRLLTSPFALHPQNRLTCLCAHIKLDLAL